MASCSEHHKVLTNGVGKCSVPMWAGGCPAGFCDNPAYGEPTEEGRKRYNGYVPHLACFYHGGPNPPMPTNTKAILMYLHCALCLKDGLRQHLEVGWTKEGIQVWCAQHDCNVVHIDFEGQTHPANTTRKESPDAD